jgi:cytochrome P450
VECGSGQETSPLEAELRPPQESYTAFCMGQLAEPYPLLRSLQEEDPVHWCPDLDVWLMTRYDDVLKGLSDRRFSNDRARMNVAPIPPDVMSRFEPLAQHLSNWLGFTDPPKHTRMRQAIQGTINTRLARTRRNRIADIAVELLDRMPSVGPDLVGDFAVRLPTIVICEILGITSYDSEFKHHCDILLDFAGSLGAGLVDAANNALDSLQALKLLFAELLEERRGAPRGDLLTILVRALDSGMLTSEEVTGLCVFLFVAGFETTVSLIANGLLLFLRYPDQVSLIRSDPILMRTAVEEILRFESPLPVITRLAACDIEIRGRTIRQGDGVAFHVGAANRDPEKFDQPDVFDVSQKRAPHLALGWAAHSCLGAPLARAEGALAFEAILSRFPSFPGASYFLQDPRWKTTISIRCPEALRVNL